MKLDVKIILTLLTVVLLSLSCGGGADKFYGKAQRVLLKKVLSEYKENKSDELMTEAADELVGVSFEYKSSMSVKKKFENSSLIKSVDIEDIHKSPQPTAFIVVRLNELLFKNGIAADSYMLVDFINEHGQITHSETARGSSYENYALEMNVRLEDLRFTEYVMIENIQIVEQGADKLTATKKNELKALKSMLELKIKNDKDADKIIAQFQDAAKGIQVEYTVADEVRSFFAEKDSEIAGVEISGVRIESGKTMFMIELLSIDDTLSEYYTAKSIVASVLNADGDGIGTISFNVSKRNAFYTAFVDFETIMQLDKLKIALVR